MGRAGLDWLTGSCFGYYPRHLAVLHNERRVREGKISLEVSYKNLRETFGATLPSFPPEAKDIRDELLHSKSGPGNMSGQEIKLPDLEGAWRWPRTVSPHLPEIEQDCLHWSASFVAFDYETQCLVHEKGKLSQ